MNIERTLPPVLAFIVREDIDVGKRIPVAALNGCYSEM